LAKIAVGKGKAVDGHAPGLRGKNLNAYALCGRTCVADLNRWLRPDGLVCQPAPELVFERGDIGEGRLSDLLVKHGYQRPIFKPGKKPWPTKLGVVQPFAPLQAADWLAYEAFRVLKDPGASDDPDTWRWPMRQFFRHMTGTPGFWLGKTLERLKQDLAAMETEHRPPIVLGTMYELD
jgi:hypothetical protein